MGAVRLGVRVLRAAQGLAAAAASALALFGALNLLVGLLGGTDRNHLWVQGGSPTLVTLGAAAFALGRFGAGRLGSAAPWLHRLGAWLLATLCALDALAYAQVRAGGSLVSPLGLSLSQVLALLLSWAGLAGPASPLRSRWHGAARSGLAAAAGLLLIAAHLLTFGASDYRRPADVAVVFGSAVRADGSPSGSLLDRTLTACALYRDGLVRRIVLSGGRDPAVPQSEPACMAAVARRAGVPSEALLLDETGATSEATLATLVTLNRQYGWQQVLLVSHDYHLARLALLAQAHGISARTVPALETRPWPDKQRFVWREIAAFCWHFARTWAQPAPS